MSKVSPSLMKLKNPRTDRILQVLAAFLGTWQVGYLLSLTAAYGASWGIVLTLVFTADLALILFSGKWIRTTKDEKFKKRFWFAFVTGLLFGLTLVAGYELQYAGATEAGGSGKLKMVLRAVCLLAILFPAFYYAFYKLEKFKGVSPAKRGEVKCKKIFFLSWLAIFIAYIPAFLAYYPMILSYDFHSQVLMAEGGFPDYWMHHPYLSTLMIAGFYYLGKAIGNVSLGMAFMGITHMLVSSCTYAYLVTVVSRMIPKKWVPYVTAAVLALMPVNPVMVLCTTKDVIFSDFFILFACLLIVRFWFHEGDGKGKKTGLDIAIILSGIMACLWRNNMVYAVVVCGLLVLIFVKKKYKLLILAFTVLIYLGNVGGIAFLRDVVIHDQHGTNAIEMMSVIVQAYGRTETMNRGNLPEDVEETISKYIPEEYWDNYNPALSDPLKNMLAYTYYDSIDGKMGTVLSDWIKVGLQYPDQYIDSFLDTTRGFWFIDDTSYADVLGASLEDNMGIIYTYYSSESYAVEEIPHTALWPAAYEFYEKLISRNDVLRIPVLNLLFKPAFYTLLTFFAFIVFLYKKEWKKLGYVSFSVLYILTMFLGPVVQFRYAYPWMITFIPLMALVVTKEQQSLPAPETAPVQNVGKGKKKRG